MVIVCCGTSVLCESNERESFWYHLLKVILTMINFEAFIKHCSELLSLIICVLYSCTEEILLWVKNLILS